MRRSVMTLCIACTATLQVWGQAATDSCCVSPHTQYAIACRHDSISSPTPTDNNYPVEQGYSPTQPVDAEVPTDNSYAVEQVRKDKKPFIKKVGTAFTKLFNWFSDVDTAYIEPQKYNYAAMLQNTNTYERYTINSVNNNTFTFAPDPKIKFGPYFGWRWLFLGYTVDFAHLGSKSKSTEFDLSLYTAVFGIDLFYRKTGSNYKISRAEFNSTTTVNTRPLHNVGFDGINVGIKGFNLYYIFNHRRFSYPAAFSQSTIQRHSCGSWLCGLGYTKHSLKIDWDKLYNTVADRLGDNVANKYMDSQLKFGEIKYTDLSVSCGYAYNWVFARNWLAAASASLAVGYKNATGNNNTEVLSFRNFSMNNFNIDGVGRFGIVWNNMRWFAGMSAIMHTYNYNREEFSTNSIFGSLNIYFGINFNKRK